MLPRVVLLPGMDGTGALFRPFLAAAKGEFSATVIQYPTDKLLDYAALAELVSSQLPVDERFVLLAESFSGPIAISLAASKPKGLTGLVLCATFARNPRPALGRLAPVLGLLHLARMPAGVISFLFLGRFATSELHDDLSQVFRKLDRSVVANLLRSILEVDVTGELEQIEIPVLYLMASEDRLVPASAAKLFESSQRNRSASTSAVRAARGLSDSEGISWIFVIWLANDAVPRSTASYRQNPSPHHSNPPSLQLRGLISPSALCPADHFP